MTTSTTQQRSSAPKLLLQAEGLAVMLAALFLYANYGGSWLLFGLLVLLPDVSFIGYLINPQVGSVAYNLVHSYTAPLLVAIFALIFASSMGIAVAIIWFFHIGMDRAIGYGLKYGDAFKHTHLGKV